MVQPITAPAVAPAGTPSPAAEMPVEAFAASNAGAGLLVAFWLSEYIRTLPRSRPELLRAHAAALARQARRFASAPAMQPDARQSLAHLAEVGAAAMQLGAAALAHDGRGMGDDRAVVAAFARLQQQVAADGRIDDAERAVLHGAVSVVSFEPPPASVTSMLWLLASGRTLPASAAEAVPIEQDLSGPFHAKLHRNAGVQRVSAQYGYPPQGYRWISPNDPLARNRNASVECFTFALSRHARWEMPEDVGPDEILRTQYRPLDLAIERARPGDIVAYYPLIWSLDPAKQEVIAGGAEHLAVVASVDAAGRPLRVVSKAGLRMGVFEHPVDEAPLSIGLLWGVFRTK